MLSLTSVHKEQLIILSKWARAVRDAVYICLKHVSKLHGWNIPDRLIDYTIKKYLRFQKNQVTIRSVHRCVCLATMDLYIVFEICLLCGIGMKKRLVLWTYKIVDCTFDLGWF